MFEIIKFGENPFHYISLCKVFNLPYSTVCLKLISSGFSFAISLVVLLGENFSAIRYNVGLFYIHLPLHLEGFEVSTKVSRLPIPEIFNARCEILKESRKRISFENTSQVIHERLACMKFLSCSSKI